MIYIFKGIQGICSLPGLMCKACADACAHCNCNICQDCCDALQGWCTNMSTCLRTFMSRPLSTYVIFCTLISIAEIYYCFQQDANCKWPDSQKDAAIVSLSMWLNIQIAFAILNLVFAPYMQTRIWWMIMDELKISPPETDPKTGKQIVPKKDVQDAFRRVFLEDFGVLFYFFAIIGSVVWSWKGDKWRMPAAGEAGLTDACSPETAATLGRVLFGLAFVYTFCWYCCPCCAKAIELEQARDGNFDEKDDHESGSE
jgi:hypothetical protein